MGAAGRPQGGWLPVWLMPARHADLTQSELAARLGKPQSFVSDYERGQRRIDLLEFLLIVRAMNGSPLDIFGEITRKADVRES